MVDDARVITSSYCAGGPGSDGISFPRDPESTHIRAGTRAVVAAYSPLSGESTQLSLLIMRKPGSTMLRPLILSNPGSLDSTWKLTLESTGVQVETNPTQQSDKASTPLRLLPQGGGVVGGVVLMQAKERVTCHADGRPVLATREGTQLLVGLVVGPGSCDDEGILHVALIAPELMWLVQASACTQNQQMMFTVRSSVTPGCQYQFSAN
jgi:hypothetical protein